MNAKQLARTLVLLVTVLALGGCATAPAVPQQAVATPAPLPVQPTLSGPAQAPQVIPAQPPRDLTALVGAGQDTTAILTFAPQQLKVRVGDTVTWKYNTNEIHTVTFFSGSTPSSPVALPGGGPNDVIPLFTIARPNEPPPVRLVNPEAANPTRQPGAPVEAHNGTGYYNSGIMSNQPSASGAPANDTFQLTFAKPGTYQYVCLIHPDVMHGTVEVVDSTATDVPSQSDIDARAQAEISQLTQLANQAKAEGQNARKDPGPNGTNLFSIRAGNYEFNSLDQRTQTFEFLPKDVTIKAGDTVIWSSSRKHVVAFDPDTPQEWFIPNPDANDQLMFNSRYAVPAKPSGTYDPTKLYTSGIFGSAPGGDSWALTFDKPGTYEYFCAIHRNLGMKGTVIVQP